MTIIPILVFWSLLTWGMFSRVRSLHLYLFFMTIPLSSFAVIPVEASAGMTITGPPVVASFMFLRSLLSQRTIRNYLSWAFDMRKLGLLFLFWFVAILVTLVAPRYFTGRVEVVPLKVSDVGFMGTAYLRPTMQNISQALYLTVSVASVFLFCQRFINAKSRQDSLKAVEAGAVVTILTGFLDLSSSYLPIAPLLEIFRTAGYSLNTEVYFNDVKRVVGLTPEASTYGGTCIFFLSVVYFTKSTRGKLSIFQAFRYIFEISSLAYLVFLSTSSSAYVALFVLAVFACFEWFYRQTFLGSKSLLGQGLLLEFIVGLAVLLIASLAIMYSPGLRQNLSKRIEERIVNKTSSSSYEERSMWTVVSAQAIWDTYGFGCGLGGTRASNKIVAIVSNTGVLGGVAYGCFVIFILVYPAPKTPADVMILHSLRWSFLPIVSQQLLVGTTPDFGLEVAWIFGMAASIAFQTPNTYEEEHFVGIDKSSDPNSLNSTVLSDDRTLAAV